MKINKRSETLILIFISLIIVLPINVLANTDIQDISTIGNQKVLVILLNFTDVNPITDPSQWHDRIFDSNAGSLSHYYGEVSEGVLNLVPADELSGTINDGIVNPYRTARTLLGFRYLSSRKYSLNL